jgi:hypothetical protein
MNLENLRNFFKGDYSIDEITQEINAEMKEFRDARRKKGTSSPVYISNDNFRFELRKQHVRKLCDMYLKGKLNEWHLEYLCNLIELSQSFSLNDEEIEDAVFELSSPEIHSELTPELVKRICDEL